MARREFTFPSADGKTPIHAVEWLPDGEIRAVVQISHGVSEFILRYEPFAEYLNAHGFAVVGHDHIGHGDSLAPGAPRMYFGPKGSWNWVTEDLEQRRKLAKEQFPDVPYFLLGHSMGSFLARTHLIRYPGAVDGAIIMGTGHMAGLLVAGGKLIAAVESLRLGEENSAPIINTLSFNTYNKIFAPNRTAFDWLSVNTENVDWYISHPLCGGNPSLGLFREMLGGIAFMKRAANTAKMAKDTPILFISGAMDPVGDCSKGVKLAYESFLKAGMQDVSLKLYPGLRHEILCETGCEEVFADILAWMEGKLPVTQ